MSSTLCTPYSVCKIHPNEDLPDASGWEDDDAVRKTCSPNWCKDAPDLVVSSSIEEAIKAKERELRYKESYDEDPNFWEMVLQSLHMVSVFGYNKPFNPEYKRKSIWY